MAKPPKPTVPAPPLRSAPSTFSSLAEAFLNFFPTFATYLDDVGDFTSTQADNALAAALGGTLPSPTGHAGKPIRVKADATGVEFAAFYTTTATAGGTTTLVNASADGQFFTGTLAQTIVLPVVTTLALGRQFEVTNNSTQPLTVNSSGGNLVATVPAKTVMSFTCILLTGTTAASWDAKAEGFDITPALMRAQLGLVIGTDVQAAIAGVEGDLIYRNAAGWARLGKGAAGQVLAQNAGLTAPAWSAAVQLAAVQATTTGTAFNFTGIPAWVNRITVICNNVSLSGSENLLVQLGTTGGVVATGYNATASTIAGTYVNQIASTDGFIVVGSGPGFAETFTMTICRLGPASSLWVASHNGFRTGSTIQGGGSITLDAALDRVRLTRTGTDTFDAGSVTISYE